jgi:hypothetical protein
MSSTAPKTEGDCASKAEKQLYKVTHNEPNVEDKLRATVNRPIHLGAGHPFGIHDKILIF